MMILIKECQAQDNLEIRNVETGNCSDSEDDKTYM
jgi:hypothetical protein